jgi:hypothetical protein
VTGLGPHDLLRARDQPLELFRVTDRDEAVLRAPHDQGRAPDAAEALADRVVGERVERVDEPEPARTADLLGDQRRREPFGRGDDEPHEQPPRPRPACDRVRAGADERGPRRQQRLPVAKQSEDPVVALVLHGETRRADEHERLDPRRVLDRDLGGDEPAHRVAHEDGRSDPELLEQRVDEPAVARDRDLVRRHLGRAEPGKVEGDDAMSRRREVGEVLEPVLPRAREPVDEHHRRLALAQLDDVDLPPVDLHEPPARLPGDVHPRRAPGRSVWPRIDRQGATGDCPGRGRGRRKRGCGRARHAAPG